MCGIAGVINFSGVKADPDLLRKMASTLIHRGPDGEGIYTDGPMGLSHRRLAILDLTEAGHQPMVSADKNLVISYNGEIYNFQELRKELESAGVRFKSRSDTEVILEAYRKWGADCVNRLNGMFAFVIWDKTQKEIFLARDRYGIKPLYYGFFGQSFLFASEWKAMLVHGDVRREMDHEALYEYFTFQNMFTDRTWIQGIKLFPAGCTAVLSHAQSEKELSFRRYWDFEFKESLPVRSEEEYMEELDRLFRQAVKRQLVSDVEVGAYLSGGMDSGSITAIAASEMPYMKSFTCGFDLHSASGMELAFDERDKAELMSYRFKTEHYEMVLKAGDMERVMPRLAWHIEEPRVGQSYPNFYISQLAGKFVKVALSGAGGDELFGGYPWRYYRPAASANFDDYIDHYYQYWQRLIPNSLLQKVFQPVWSRVKSVWTRDIFKDVFKNHLSTPESPEDYVNHSLYFEAKTFLHGLLNIEDKLSMAHGLEVRVPFLDNDLVDFAMRLPVRFKLARFDEQLRMNENEPGPKTNKYFEKTHDGKILLRKLMRRYVPSEIVDAAKQGFSAPDASWFKGDSIRYVQNVLFNRHSALYQILSFEAVQPLIREHLQGHQNRRLLIWSLLSLELWIQTFMQGD